MTSSNLKQEKAKDCFSTSSVSAKTKSKQPKIVSNNVDEFSSNHTSASAGQQPGQGPHGHQHHFDSPSTTSSRLRAKERDRLGKGAVAGAGSSLCVQGKPGRAQRERRRTKRRESYIQSTEGTSTGDEENCLGEGSLGDITNRQSYVSHSPPDFAEKTNFCRGNRSPSDLDADDEDNQDYDSTSMVSNLDAAPLSPHIVAGATFTNSKAGVSGPSSSSAFDENSSFRTQFQKIRVAGMQKLVDVGENCGAGGGESETGALLSDSSRESDAVFNKPLNKSGQEKTLMQNLNEKEEKIAEMEKTIQDLNLRLHESEMQQERLKVENESLRTALDKNQ